MLGSTAQQASVEIRTHNLEWAARIASRVGVVLSGKPQEMLCNVGEKSVRDIGYHLDYLAEALWSGDPNLFVSYVEWAKVLFGGLGFDARVLSVTLQEMQHELPRQLPPDHGQVVVDYLTAALVHVEEAASAPVSFVGDAVPFGQLASNYLQLLLRGDRQAARQLIVDAAESGMRISDIYLYVFQASQREIGRLWQMNQLSVAQEHYCTAATQFIMSQLYPYIFATERVGKRMVAASVGGELHEIGIRMVSDFFELEGWDTYYLGANTPEEGVVRAASDHNADLVALSVTLTPHVPQVVELISAIRDMSTAPRVLVGGYPFNLSASLWQRVGADGYAADAASAVITGNQLVP